MGGLFNIIDSFTGEGGAEASISAGDITADALRDAIPGIEFETERARNLLVPFSSAGEQALREQQALLGLLGPEAQTQATQNIQESPSQQFIRQRQQRALLRNQAAIGGLGGGNVRTDLQEQASGFAMEDIENQRRQLAMLTGQGLGAAGMRGEIGIRGAETIGELGIGAANAQASGLLGAAQSRSQGTQNLINTGTSIAALSLLSDKNLKTNVRDMTPEECMNAVLSLDIKAWEYIDMIGSPGIHIGPMAQDSPECIKIDGKEMLDLHSELMLIAGALQYMRDKKWH